MIGAKTFGQAAYEAHAKASDALAFHWENLDSDVRAAWEAAASAIASALAADLSTVDGALRDAALLRRAVGVLSDIERTRSETAAVLDAFAKRPELPDLIERHASGRAPSAVEAIARLPHVIVGSAPAIDRMLEAYYRSAIERIAREFDALTPDLLAAAREAEATAFREELRAAERQIAAIGAAWRTAFPESRFSGPNVEAAIPLVGREFQRLRRVAEVAALFLDEAEALNASATVVSVERATGAKLRRTADALRRAVSALVSEREEEVDDAG